VITSDDPALATLCRGVEHLSKDEWNEAQGEFEKGKIEFSKDPRFNVALEHLHLTKDDLNSAESELHDAIQRFPQEAQFHLDLGALYLSTNRPDEAWKEFALARELDPGLTFEPAILQTVKMRVVDPEVPLTVWNSGRADLPPGPVVEKVVSPEGWPGSVLSHTPGTVLSAGDWRTARTRLNTSRSYDDMNLGLAETFTPRHFNALISASTKKNSWLNLASLAGGVLPRFQTASLNFSNIGRTGIHWDSSFRFQVNRRRGDGSLRMTVPIPLLGPGFVNLGGTWRFERWDISSIAADPYKPDGRFDYKATSFNADLETVPHHRVKVRSGITYVNRAAKGSSERLSLDGRNTGKFRLGTTLRLLDSKLKSDLAADGFVSRKSILGDFNFKGGTVSLRNSVELSGAVLEINATAGASRGTLPVDEYFVLGFPSFASSGMLHAHKIETNGHYGASPMGTGFVLYNAALSRRVLKTRPFETPKFMNRSFIVPPFEASVFVFFDTGRTMDRLGVFDKTGWHKDLGFGVDLGKVRLWLAWDLREHRHTRGNQSVF
jgi:hypothetical protein